MDYWISEKECTGCAACANVCSVNAISMVANSLSGFLYPLIDKSLCLDCNLCKETCPVFRRIEEKNSNYRVESSKNKIEAYAAWSKNDEVRFGSTSGGVFTEFAKTILSREGFVYGAGFNEKMEVVHFGIESVDDIEKLAKSKYVQSFIGNVYYEIKTKLINNYNVLFVGSPCQVAGLKDFLKHEYNRLYTIEFICVGVNSPLAYRKWLEELEKKHNSKIKYIWFKYKINGWRQSPFYTRIIFENRKELVFNRETNFYMKGFLQGNYYLRQSCSRCKFKGNNRKADIVFGDFWGVDTQQDDDKGTSIVLIYSKKGRILFNKTKKLLNYYAVEFKDISKSNPRFFTPTDLNEKSEVFYKDLQKAKFSEVVKKYIEDDEPLNEVLNKIMSSQK